MPDRSELQRLLVQRTGCSAQHDGWPCNTCFHAMNSPGMDGWAEEHGPPIKVDGGRLHELWEATLRFRGDYTEDDIPLGNAEVAVRVEELLDLLRAGAPAFFGVNGSNMESYMMSTCGWLD